MTWVAITEVVGGPEAVQIPILKFLLKKAQDGSASHIPVEAEAMAMDCW